LELSPPQWIWSTEFFFQTFQILHDIFLLNFSNSGEGQFRKACRSRKKNPNSRKSRANSRNLLEPVLWSRKEENLYGHCAINNARRILSKGSTLLRSCCFWSKKLCFQKNFGRNFNAVERVINGVPVTHKCMISLDLEIQNFWVWSWEGHGKSPSFGPGSWVIERKIERNTWLIGCSPPALWRLVQWLGWVFETQEKKQRKKDHLPNLFSGTSFQERDCSWGFTSLPTQEAGYGFSGFIPTNKQTNSCALLDIQLTLLCVCGVDSFIEIIPVSYTGPPMLPRDIIVTLR